jgi:hypothetical protein
VGVGACDRMISNGEGVIESVVKLAGKEATLGATW